MVIDVGVLDRGIGLVWFGWIGISEDLQGGLVWLGSRLGWKENYDDMD